MLKSVAAVNCQANISPVHLHNHSGAAVAALGSVEGCQPGLEMKGHVGGQLQVTKICYEGFSCTILPRVCKPELQEFF